MTDLNHATRVLLAVLDTIPAHRVVTCDDWRTEADTAQLNPAERGAAPRNAARLGYLEPLVVERDGRRFLACEPSTREHGKGNRVLAYVRTGLPVPEHLCVLEVAG